MTPQECVFDNLLLRHKILTKLEYIKYKETLQNLVKNLVFDSVISKWHKHCSCELCKQERENA